LTGEDALESLLLSFAIEKARPAPAGRARIGLRSMAMRPAFEIGVVAFADTDSADRVVDGLRAMSATHLVNDVSLIEHHANGRFSVHAYSQETSRGANIGAGAVIGTMVGALLLGPFGLLGGTHRRRCRRSVHGRPQ
jgi:hypothetical protein